MGECFITRRGGGGRRILGLNDVTFEYRLYSQTSDGSTKLYRMYLILPSGITWGDIERFEVEKYGFRGSSNETQIRVLLLIKEYSSISGFEYSSGAWNRFLVVSPQGTDTVIGVSQEYTINYGSVPIPSPDIVRSVFILLKE